MELQSKCHQSKVNHNFAEIIETISDNHNNYTLPGFIFYYNPDIRYLVLRFRYKVLDTNTQVPSTA